MLDKKSDQTKDEKQQEKQIESVKEYGQMPMPEDNGEKSKVHCLTIIGQIEGHIALPPQNKTTKYEHVIPQLVSIRENNNIKGLLVILNTVGGDVEAGLAIAEMISSLGKPVVSLVLGGAHSIGVPLAVSADYSFITPSATMTIHPVRMSGTVIGVPQTFEYFDQMQERIVAFIVQHSGISQNRLKELMLDTGKLAKDVGTIVIGKDAVKEGMINAVGGLDDALCKLHELVEQQDKENE